MFVCICTHVYVHPAGVTNYIYVLCQIIQKKQYYMPMLISMHSFVHQVDLWIYHNYIKFVINMNISQIIPKY